MSQMVLSSVTTINLVNIFPDVVQSSTNYIVAVSAVNDQGFSDPSTPVNFSELYNIVFALYIIHCMCAYCVVCVTLLKYFNHCSVITTEHNFRIQIKVAVPYYMYLYATNLLTCPMQIIH